MQATVSGARLAGRAYIHFSLVRVADLNSVYARISARTKTIDELHFTSVLSFLAVRNVSVLLVQFRIVTLHCVWQPS